MKDREFLEIPVVIVYFGGSPNYLNFSLKSANDYNRRVVLIGDHTNQNLWKNHWDSERIDSCKYQAFQKEYIHLSTNSQRFELSCIKRFFFLEKWMQETNVKEVFLLDGDILSFANYSREVYSKLPNDCIATLMTPKDRDDAIGASSPHFSYWKLEALESFTDFCIEAYNTKAIRAKLEEQYQDHIEMNKLGGICDMTLLYLWSEKNRNKIFNLAQTIDDTALDSDINSSENYFSGEYETRFRIKKIRFKKGLPYGYNKVLRKEVRFLCLHCQGKAKRLMNILADRHLKNFHFLKQLILLLKN